MCDVNCICNVHSSWLLVWLRFDLSIATGLSCDAWLHTMLDVITMTCLTLRSALDSSLVIGLLAFTKVKRETLEQWQSTRLRVEATVWFFLSLLCAIFIPDIIKVIQPLGGLAAAFIFIFPGEP